MKRKNKIEDAQRVGKARSIAKIDITAALNKAGLKHYWSRMDRDFWFYLFVAPKDHAKACKLWNEAAVKNYILPTSKKK